MGNIFRDEYETEMNNFTWTEAMLHYLRINTLFKNRMALELPGIKFAI